MENVKTYLEPSIDYKEPTVEKQMKGHKNGITSLYYSPNERQVATGSLDNSVMLWDFRGTMRSYRFQGHDEGVMDVTFSPTGKYMASASRDKTVRLWVPTVTGSTGMFKAHSQTVRSVQFSPDGTKILTASDDKIVKLWSSEKHKFISSFVGHTNWVRMARLSNDGSVIASCSDDKTARLWDPDSGTCIHTYKDQKGHGTTLSWHPSGCYVAVGTSQGNIKLYDIRTHNLVQYYSIHNDGVTQISFHPSGSYIITSSKDGKMKILDLLEGHPIFTLTVHSGAINAVGFSPTGDSFASAGDDKLVFIWRTNFTELPNEVNENAPQNPSTVPPSLRGSASQTKTASTRNTKYQGVNIWNQCYHNTKYPISNFVHLNDISESIRDAASSQINTPKANSTEIQGSTRHSTSHISEAPHTSFRKPGEQQRSIPSDRSVYSHNDDELDVGDISHIPRPPISPGTYTIPSLINKSTGTIAPTSSDEFFGMISLKQNDVCYTNGTIEWVGSKRSFPINSGFKILNEDSPKKFKKAKVNDIGTEMRECECADVLPTVNAIVNHLNALHEAVDIVDLRLNHLEETYSGYKLP